MTVLCACGTLLDESHPAAITTHGLTATHVAWLGIEREDTMPNPIDQLDDPAFIATPEGQAALEAANQALRDQRRASKAAYERERRARIKAEKIAATPELEVVAPAVVVDGKVIASAHVPANKPLKLGTEPIDVNGTMQYPILHRDGTIAGHQADHYIWRCPTCGRRLRAAECSGRDTGVMHKFVKAPEGYRRDDRVAR